MITPWQFAAVCVIAFGLLALILVITIREYDDSMRRRGNEEDEREESARYAPQWQSDRDTDEYSSPFALGDIHPESLHQFVDRITAEEAAKREARALDETSGATQRAGRVTPRISMSGTNPDNGTIPRRSAGGNQP